MKIRSFLRRLSHCPIPFLAIVTLIALAWSSLFCHSYNHSQAGMMPSKEISADQEKLLYLIQFYVVVPELQPNSFLAAYCKETDVPIKNSSGVTKAGPFFSKFEAEELAGLFKNAHVETSCPVDQPIKPEEAKQLYKSMHTGPPEKGVKSYLEVMSATRATLMGMTFYRFLLGEKSLRTDGKSYLRPLYEECYAIQRNNRYFIEDGYPFRQGLAVISKGDKLFSINQGPGGHGSGYSAEQLDIARLQDGVKPHFNACNELPLVSTMDDDNRWSFDVMRISINQSIVQQRFYSLKIIRDCDKGLPCQTLAIKAVSKGPIKTLLDCKRYSEKP
jgi:hypothetical protein